MNYHQLGDQFENACRNELKKRWPGSKVLEAKKTAFMVSISL